MTIVILLLLYLALPFAELAAIIVLAVLNGEPEGENAPHILGLHVVEQIINAHGGSVQFVNRDPHGAKVMMQLPLAKDEK